MKFKKKPLNSELEDKLKNKKKIKEDIDTFQFSFKDFSSDGKYVSSFRDWQNDKILSHALDILMSYTRSLQSLQTCIDGDKFCKYGDWPSHSLIDQPEHVSEDACWGRIHVNGKSIIVGHIVRNSFYVVHLDKTHAFYPTRNDSRVKKKDKL